MSLIRRSSKRNLGKKFDNVTNTAPTSVATTAAAPPDVRKTVVGKKKKRKKKKKKSPKTAALPAPAAAGDDDNDDDNEDGEAETAIPTPPVPLKNVTPRTSTRSRRGHRVGAGARSTRSRGQPSRSSARKQAGKATIKASATASRPSLRKKKKKETPAGGEDEVKKDEEADQAETSSAKAAAYYMMKSADIHRFFNPGGSINVHSLIYAVEILAEGNFPRDEYEVVGDGSGA